MAAKELIDDIENGNITNSVNLPNVSMARSGKYRICVVHKNIPNMLSTITTIFAKDNLNIENMVNQSKKDMAYTMLDANRCDVDKIKSDLATLDGIVRVRVI